MKYNFFSDKKICFDEHVLAYQKKNNYVLKLYVDNKKPKELLFFVL